MENRRGEGDEGFIRESPGVKERSARETPFPWRSDRRFLWMIARKSQEEKRIKY